MVTTKRDADRHGEHGGDVAAGVGAQRGEQDGPHRAPPGQRGDELVGGRAGQVGADARRRRSPPRRRRTPPRRARGSPSRPSGRARAPSGAGSPSTSAEASLSRLPVGSSAKTMAGLVTSARAIATRCCWPPESSPGRWRAGRASPRVSTTWSSRSRSARRPASSSGSRMFCSAVSIGQQVEGLEDEADVVAAEEGQRGVVERRRARRRRRSRVPPVGWSSPARQCISVDLPEPDGPMMAVNRPAGRSRSTPRRACTAASPRP